jgi:hypothetical protein
MAYGFRAVQVAALGFYAIAVVSFLRMHRAASASPEGATPVLSSEPVPEAVRLPVAPG